MRDLITDRTEADALLINSKGRYTYQDLNRVEQAVEDLCMLGVQLDIHLNLTTKTDWAAPQAFSVDTWPTESQMVRYLNNVHALCDGISLVMPLPDTMVRLTWEGANAIEQALQAVHDRMQGILQTYQFSGELIAGEENGI